MPYPPTNDTVEWDWIIWETEGNPSEKYQRGGTTRKLGLYRLNYHKLRSAGEADWKPPHDDHTIGGGYVKVAVIESMKYDAHEALIKTFLPCFSIVDGKVTEPNEREVSPKHVLVRRTVATGSQTNTLDVAPPYIVMPYNYDDNTRTSAAIGSNIGVRTEAFWVLAEAKRLAAELVRWATASRSSIGAFQAGGVDVNTLFVKRLRDDDWDFQNDKNKDLKKSGLPDGETLIEFQNDHGDQKFYSVKTGVQFVGGEDQTVNNKHILESNSIHAMHRSNLISATINRIGAGKFEGVYQIEILSILLKKGTWDGIQIRDVGIAGRGQVWFPALAIPSHGKAFCASWNPTQDWVPFWETSFARPLGRAKAEMLVYFGMQHMTSNSQNFLVVFDRTAGADSGRSKHVILRDIGDTLYNNYFFDVLKTIDPSYGKEWDTEVADTENGVVLGGAIGGGYFNPVMTRIGASIVFFYPPFVQKDIATDPQKARILSRWSIAHNHGFLDYMRDKIGYTNNWKDGADNVTGDLPTRLRTQGAMDKKNDAVYPQLVSDVLGLNPISRWRLIREIENECGVIDPANVADANNLVNAHEMLICAEVQCYIQSVQGKEALTALHKGVPVITQPTTVVAGPECFQCKKDAAGNAKGWQRCQKCGDYFCNTCMKLLSYPKGIPKSLYALTDERACSECGDITVPMT